LTYAISAFPMIPADLSLAGIGAPDRQLTGGPGSDQDGGCPLRRTRHGRRDKGHRAAERPDRHRPHRTGAAPIRSPIQSPSGGDPVSAIARSNNPSRKGTSWPFS